jgi:hypothetical protein
MMLDERSALASTWNQMLRRRSIGFGFVRKWTLRRKASRNVFRTTPALLKSADGGFHPRDEGEEPC